MRGRDAALEPKALPIRPHGEFRRITGHGADANKTTRMTRSCRPPSSEIRPVRSWNRGILMGVELQILGTDIFPQLVDWRRHVSQCCGPRHREDTFIFDCQM